MQNITNPTRISYPSDMNQAQWDAIDLLLPCDAERGRTRENSLREVVNAINYRWSTGCSWRMLPHDYPTWQTVYSYYRIWQSKGLLGEMRRILISRKFRDRSTSRMPEMPTTTNPDSLPNSTDYAKPVTESLSDRLTTSAWPAESSWSPRRS
jgi:transposase